MIQPNGAQQKAIESLVGPVLVLAGPGTGKTFTLTERILFLLGKGVDPRRILALTFTENAAEEMHSRLQARAGLAGRSVPIHTFHGFCSRLIQRYPDVFERSAEIRALDEVTRYSIVREALEKLAPKHLRTERGDIFFYVREIVQKISLVKREAIRKEAFHDTVRILKREAEKALASDTRKTAQKQAERRLKMAQKLEEFWKVYELYGEELDRRSLMDYDDMILWVSNAFREQEDFLQEVREGYDYLHADEFQDNNTSQNEILYALAGEDPNLFVVGDEDQSIFRFHGACAENMRDFLRRYPDATVVTLHESHRSSQPILDFAHALMHGGAREVEIAPKVHVDKLLRSTQKKPATPAVRLAACADRENELEWIAREMARLREKDPSLRWSDFALLCRRNQETQDIAAMLQRHAIPFRIVSNEETLASPPLQNLLGLLRAVCRPEDSLAINHALSFPPFEIPVSDLHHLNHFARSRPMLLWELLQTEMQEIELTARDRIVQARDFLTEAREAFQKKHLSHAFLDFAHSSGFLKFYMAAETNEAAVLPEAIAALRRFTRFIQQFELAHPKATLANLLHHVELAELYGLSLKMDAEADAVIGDVVTIETAHRAKGSEFRVVFVTQVNARNWEERRPPRDLISIPASLVLPTLEGDEEGGADDERRLLYVAVTRAREKLCLTRPREVDGDAMDESIFVAGLKEHLKGAPSWEELPAIPVVEMARLQLAPQPWGENLNEFLRQKTRAMKLSPTAMRQYELCPRRFMYSHVFLIPSKMERALAYGQIVHEALRHFFNEVRTTGRWPKSETLLDHFQRQLQRQPLETDEDFRELEKTGREELSRFYDWCLEQTPPRVLETELSVPGVAWGGEEGIRLSGKFDRIDQAQDGSWVVVDYKTGKPRSENEFFGKTKSSEGEYWDQFRFYKLLNELAQQPKPITRGRVVYLRDPAKSQEFELNAGHVEEIGKKIGVVSKKILAMEFQRISDNQSMDACRRCSYIHLCRSGI